MTDAGLSLLVLGVAVALFIWNRLPVGSVAILVSLALLATGLLDAETVLAGFGDPVVIFIATLFVVSEGLDATGVTAWLGNVISRRAGSGAVALLVTVMALSALLSALITPNGAVAALLPVVVAVSRRAGAAPSRMLIPLAFSASAGALLILSGSPVNVIVSDAARDATGVGFGFFEFTLVGVPLVLGTTVVAVLFGHRLLPKRSSATLPQDYSAHADTLAQHYALERGFYRLAVSGGSSLCGTPWETADLRQYPGVELIGLQRADGLPPEADHQICAGDVLVVTGPGEEVTSLAVDAGLSVVKTPLTKQTQAAMLGREVGVAEVVIPPRSRLVGETMFPGMARREGLVVLAIRRLGKDRGAGKTELAEGDSLLLHGTWPSIESLSDNKDVLVVDAPDAVRRQAAPLGPPAYRAIGVLLVMVGLLASGVVPPAVGGLIGAVLMILLKVIAPQQAYRAVSWQTVVLIGGLIPLSVAIRTSGAADLIAEQLVALVGEQGPRVLMIALFLVTAMLGQVVSNTATVLIIAPIAVSIAAETGVSVHPVLMLVAIAGASSFLTPIATPANMMVMSSGGYRFGDYWKLGLATMLVWMVVAVTLVPVIWPLHP